ncbi:hypothetical protein TruAng_008693 [Truncatella angustata]|nr:hypothetical protein TruAng_008693 [Truncatella angustata]
MYEERSDISGGFKAVKSINEIDQERGIVSSAEPVVQLKLIELDEHNYRIIHESRHNARQNVADPDGMLDPVIPLYRFRTHQYMKNELAKPGLDAVEKEVKAALEGKAY